MQINCPLESTTYRDLFACHLHANVSANDSTLEKTRQLDVNQTAIPVREKEKRMSDLETLIEESVDDATSPEPEVVVETPTETLEVAPEATTEVPEATEETVPDPVTTTSPDDFDKKHGLAAQTASGRENRIPYSRVRKIADNAVAEAKKKWDTDSGSKTTDFDKKLVDYQTQLKERDEKLARVEEFQKIMVNDAPRFLSMLATVPAYKQFFQSVDEAFKTHEQGKTAVAPVVPDPTDDMPQPDQKLTDGSLVYSLEGLKKLNEWNRAQARKDVLAEVDKKYGSIQKQWESDQRVQAVIPHIQAQITEARTWPMFNESEDEIVKVLQADPQISLHAAYMKVAIPKIQQQHADERAKLSTDRNKVREEVLGEIKKAPKATSAPSSPSRPTTTSTGPRNLEDVIGEAIKGIK